MNWCALEGEGRHAELSRAGPAAGALHGDTEEGEGRRLGARAVPWRRRCGQRHPQRHHADRAVRRRQRHRQHPRRPDDAAGDDEQHPLAEFPGRAAAEETGYNGPPSRSWYGIFAPAGTPRPIVDKLSKDINAIVNKPAFRDRHLTARSLVPAANTPEQFADEIKRERAVAEKVVKDAGFEPQ